MNNNIENLINEYFKNNKSIITYKDKHRSNNTPYINNANILLETQHVLNKFEDFINFIINNIALYNNEYQYTEWNYNNSIIQIEHINNANVNFPIFIKTIKDGYNIFAEVENRQEPFTFNDKIYININVNTISDKNFCKASLKHELTHIVKMYSKNSFNNMNSKKDTIAIHDIEPWLNGVVFRYKRLLYILSPSEQEAHINGTCEYIKNNKHTYKTINCNTVEKIIQNTFQFNMLNEFVEYVENLYDDYSYGRYKFLLGIGYYLKKHRMFFDTTKYLHKEFLSKYYDKKQLNQKELDFISNICDSILACIQQNLNNYKKNLFNAIYYTITK